MCCSGRRRDSRDQPPTPVSRRFIIRGLKIICWRRADISLSAGGQAPKSLLKWAESCHVSPTPCTPADTHTNIILFVFFYLIRSHTWTRDQNHESQTPEQTALTSGGPVKTAWSLLTLPAYIEYGSEEGGSGLSSKLNGFQGYTMWTKTGWCENPNQTFLCSNLQILYLRNYVLKKFQINY